MFLKKNKNVTDKWIRTLNHQVMSPLCYPLGHSNNVIIKSKSLIYKYIAISHSFSGTTSQAKSHPRFEIPMPWAFRICGRFFWDIPFHKIRLGRTVSVEQWIRQWTCNLKVMSSIPHGAIFLFIFFHSERIDAAQEGTCS